MLGILFSTKYVMQCCYVAEFLEMMPSRLPYLVDIKSMIKNLSNNNLGRATYHNKNECLAKISIYCTKDPTL